MRLPAALGCGSRRCTCSAGARREEDAWASCIIPVTSIRGRARCRLTRSERFWADCRLCELCQTRTNIVFGVGNPHARVLFVGEAPGRNEDLQGEPFVGRGRREPQRHTRGSRACAARISISRNVLKCRPPGNRDPKPDEVLACSPFLREQIRSIWPDIIVTLGNPATHFVLKTEIGITRLRGRFHQMGHFVVMPHVPPRGGAPQPQVAGAPRGGLPHARRLSDAPSCGHGSRRGGIGRRRPLQSICPRLVSDMALVRSAAGVYQSGAAADTERLGELMAPCFAEGDVAVLTGGPRGGQDPSHPRAWLAGSLTGIR